MGNYFDTNVNARINTRSTKNSKLRTETKNREDNFSAAVTTDKNSHASELFIDLDGGNINGGETVRLSGSRARTLYRLLQKHYDFTGKSV
jgi:hypothetical protein